MEIALLGYGKMGKAVEAVALERNHTIAVTIDNNEEWASRGEQLRGCDVAIDFSQPDMAVDNIRRCFAIGVPVVVGTTGWYDHLDEMVALCESGKKSLFVASNFSIGMNIMFDLNRRLARLMNRYADYDVTISETHHIHKLDAPSGTAITLANDMIEALDRKQNWTLETTLHPDEKDDAPAHANVAENSVGVTSIRQGEVAGVHVVTYDSPIDTITVTHSAKNRKGLALGAVLAAEFLAAHPGYHTMLDLLEA